MLGNEINAASWKFGLVFIIVLVALTQVPTSYEEIVSETNMEMQFVEQEIERLEKQGVSNQEIEEMYGSPPNPVDSAMNELSGLYTNIGVGAMVALGGLLGIGLVSSEVGGGMIFALLSRPVSRTRIFLTKYLTCAAFLLAAAVLGAVGDFGVAWLRDYPLGEVTWGGVALAVFLMWLVSLFVLGIAMLVSTLTRNVMQSLLVTAAVVFAFLAIPTFGSDILSSILFDYDADWRQVEAMSRVASGLTIANYWPDMSYFWPGGAQFSAGYYTFFGESRWGDFAVCLVAAIVPASVAFWIFNRKAF